MFSFKGAHLAIWSVAITLATTRNGSCAAFPAASAESDSSPRLIYEQPTVLSGNIYEQRSDGNRLLFRFERRATRSGDRLDVRRDYTYPDGTVSVREVIVYRGNEIAFYELKDLQTGGQGSVSFMRGPNERSSGTVDFQYSAGRGSKPKESRESWSADTLVNDMVGHFLSARWEALNRGEKVKCRLVVISRRETIGFTFRKIGESSWQGREVITVRLEATSPLLSPLIDPMVFTLEKAPPHRVLQYIGRTTPKVKEGNKWKDLDALTVFDWGHAQR